MRKLLILISICMIFPLITCASSPTWYYAPDSFVIKIDKDTLVAYNYYYGEHLQRIGINETMGIFICRPCGNGFYVISENLMVKEDPFESMRYDIYKVEKGVNDSIAVRIHVKDLPETYVISVNSTQGECTSCGSGRIEIKIPYNSREINCTISPSSIQPPLPVTNTGLYLGVMKMESHTIYIPESDAGKVESIDIYIPSLTGNIFSYLCVPETFMRIRDGKLNWLGQIWEECTSEIFM